MTFKAKLSELHGAITDASAEASALKNQNLADIIKAAGARLSQALEHPDLDRLDADEGQRNTPLPVDHTELQSGGSALFAAGDPGAAAAKEEARRRAAFGDDRDK